MMPSDAPTRVTHADAAVSRRANLACGPFPAVITECLELSVTHNYTSPFIRGYFQGYQIYFQPSAVEATRPTNIACGKNLDPVAFEMWIWWVDSPSCDLTIQPVPCCLSHCLWAAVADCPALSHSGISVLHLLVF